MGLMFDLGLTTGSRAGSTARRSVGTVLQPAMLTRLNHSRV